MSGGEEDRQGPEAVLAGFLFWLAREKGVALCTYYAQPHHPGGGWERIEKPEYLIREYLDE